MSSFSFSAKIQFKVLFKTLFFRNIQFKKLFIFRFPKKFNSKILLKTGFSSCIQFKNIFIQYKIGVPPRAIPYGLTPLHSVSTDLTGVTLVSDDTYWRLDWCYSSNWGYWWRRRRRFISKNLKFSKNMKFFQTSKNFHKIS